MPSIRLRKIATSPSETFQWGPFTWNIAALRQDVQEKKLRPKTEVLDREFIESYATRVLALSKDKPPVEGTPQAGGLLMHVDALRAVQMPDSTLSLPLVLLQTPPKKGLLTKPGSPVASFVLGDGNHRVCKAFFAGTQSLQVLVLSREQSNRYRL